MTTSVDWFQILEHFPVSPPSCLFPGDSSLHLRLSSWPRGRDETAGPPSTQHEYQPLEFQGSAVPFVTPLFLISSFNGERGSRIAAFEVISREDFFSFPVPLHTLNRNMGNNGRVHRPIIKTLAPLHIFFLLFALVLFFDKVHLVATQWLLWILRLFCKLFKSLRVLPFTLGESIEQDLTSAPAFWTALCHKRQ